jgi:hypothetical protein
MNSAEFLNRAIEENQLTIRAIDVKVTTLVAALLVPLAGIGQIFNHLEAFYAIWPTWYIFLIPIVFLVSWVIALACFVFSMWPMDNPATHVPQQKQFKGSFFAGGLYEFNFSHAILPRANVMAKRNPADLLHDVPRSCDDILGELVFEQMKLAYIRDVKINRIRWGFRFTSAWFFLGVIIYLASRYLS